MPRRPLSVTDLPVLVRHGFKWPWRKDGLRVTDRVLPKDIATLHYSRGRLTVTHPITPRRSVAQTRATVTGIEMPAPDELANTWIFVLARRPPRLIAPNLPARRGAPPVSRP